MTFTFPLALLLLLGLLIIIYIGFPRRAYRRTRDTISLILRCIIWTLLVLALAGAQLTQGADRLAVVFLVDQSDSVGADEREAQLAYIRDALANMPPDDEAAIIAFGANALVERPFSTSQRIDTLRSTVNSGNTDLEEAISLALALFPDDAARRIVILSDGAQTVGDARAAAGRAAATGVEISVVPLVNDDLTPDVLVTAVRVPDTVAENQLFDLGITVDSDQATPATITVTANSEVVHRENVQLEAGSNNYTLSLQAGESGFPDFRVQVELPPGTEDGFIQNNQLAAFTRVIGAPHVLVVSSSPEESGYLIDALESVDVTVDQVTPGGLPANVAALANYDSVILTNVSATQLTNRRMNALQSYVRDTGGGLVVVGGPNSYAAGGYFDTPLEDVLPVEMRLDDQQRIPQLTIAYVIDRSGSMSVLGPSGVTNLDLAKEAIIRSIDFLQPTDRAGIIGFDAEGLGIAPVQPVLDRLGLQSLVATIQSGGGTDIMAGITLAAQALQDDPSERKHIILLTDGGADPRGLVEFTQELYEQSGVTTSVIAIGSQPDFLTQMAAAGGGNYHEVTLVETIPTIFTQETVLATRSYIIEEEFVPSLFAPSPIVAGITTAPPLLGYVASQPRDTAQVVLRGSEPYYDPILAQWQYGLGRSVAFTSDATARWGANWVSWDDFARFWNQTVRWTITEEAGQNIESRVAMEGEGALLTVDARTDDGAFQNGLTLNARITPPDGGEAFTVPVRQIAPGQYQAEFAPQDEGAYLVTLYSTGGDEPVNQTTGWVMSYSPEYRATTNGGEVLAAITTMTGGRSLADDPAAVFAHTLQAQAGADPIWQPLVLLALLLIPLDIAVRRLLITRSDVQRARIAVFGTGRASQDTEERMGALMSAKARAGKTIDQPGQPSSDSSVGTRDSVSAPPASAPQTPSSPSTSSPAPSPRTDGGNLAGDLLKRRKTGDNPDTPKDESA
jgi:uncharacterized membrane protein